MPVDGGEVILGLRRGAGAQTLVVLDAPSSGGPAQALLPALVLGHGVKHSCLGPLDTLWEGE